MKFAVLLLSVSLVSALNLGKQESCLAKDKKNKQLMLAAFKDDCVDMCKLTGAYPKGCVCDVDTVAQAAANDGVVTWSELLDHMRSLVNWGAGKVKGWGGAAFTQTVLNEQACVAQDLAAKVQFKAMLKDACLDMCEQIGAATCNCP